MPGPSFDGAHCVRLYSYHTAPMERRDLSVAISFSGTGCAADLWPLRQALRFKAPYSRFSRTWAPSSASPMVMSA